MSDDQRYALTLIAFVGSVFSPYYALARRVGAADPANHCAVNVALYGDSGARWCMTERPVADMARCANSLAIGRSSLRWHAGELSIALDERAVPLPRKVKGVIKLGQRTLAGETVMLDTAGRHCWRPIAPHARIEVNLEEPHISWSGDAYFDSNWGQEPLEKAFRTWTWSRAHDGDVTRVLYDVERRDGSRMSISRRLSDNGTQDFEPPAEVELPSTTIWRIPRAVRCAPDRPPRVAKTFEDTPFYARSLVHSTVEGKRLSWVHESLSLDRVQHPLVRFMLPFRMPRWRSRPR